MLRFIPGVSISRIVSSDVVYPCGLRQVVSKSHPLRLRDDSISRRLSSGSLP